MKIYTDPQFTEDISKYTISLFGSGLKTTYLDLNEDQHSFWLEKLNDPDFSPSDYLEVPEDYEDEIPPEMNIVWKNDLICWSARSPDVSCTLKIEIEDQEKEIDYNFEEFLCKYNSSKYEISKAYYEDSLMAKMMIKEKGLFFMGQFEADSFDENKLNFWFKECPSGDFYLFEITYDGQVIENEEIDTWDVSSSFSLY